MHTPNIDALVSKSLVMRRNYVAQATCSPSRASLLTGRRPDTTHVWDLESYFRTVGGNFSTIPQFFKEHGYHTYGSGKIFHSGSASGGGDCDLCTGQDDKLWSWSVDEVAYYHGKDPIDQNNDYSWMAVNATFTDANPLRDSQTMAHTLEIIANTSALSAEDNFFIAVGFHKPHLPFVFPEEFLEVSRGEAGPSANRTARRSTLNTPFLFAPAPPTPTPVL